MSHKKTILIIGAGSMQLPCILEAKEMGLLVIATDLNPDAVGMAYADIPVVMSSRDESVQVAEAKNLDQIYKINGVLTVGTDASRTVAAIASALGLPGLRYDVAERATNKIKMRNCFADKHVPIPKYKPVWNLEEAKEAGDELGFPLVIKPADNMGARGVRKVTCREEIIDGYYNAKEAANSGQLIIEEFMPGPELSIDALVFNSTIAFTGIADRIIEHPPYFIETGHILPSNLSRELVDSACEIMEKGIKALGINHGAAKGDIKLTPDGPKIGELAARLSGGYMSGYTYPLATGVNLMRAAIELALGDYPTDIEPKTNLVSVERAIIPPPGRVISVSGVEDARQIPGVKEIFINVTRDDIIKPLRSNIGKAGNVIAVAPSRDEAVAIAKSALEKIKIEIGTPPTLTQKTIDDEARKKMGRVCRACKVCDGVFCAGQVPGMGGVGTGDSFKENVRALAKIRINTRTIHSAKNPDMGLDLFGYKLSMPVFASPLNGTKTNMADSMTEEDFNQAIVNGCEAAGTIGMVGDGATPDKYKIGLKAIENRDGRGIPIFKPREFNEEIIKRIKAAERAGAMAVGMDIDAAAFITMALKNQPVGPKTIDEIKEIRNSTTLPFILKGVMTTADAKAAADAGVDAIIISNHGGRVIDHTPGTADVLPHIVEAVRGRIRIWVDGGVRTGADVLKMLALGAEFVGIGRPLGIAAIGAGEHGVEFSLEKVKNDLKKAMILTGSDDLSKITRDLLYKSNGTVC